MSGIFITGTDTGVGKTYLTLLLAEKLIGQGMDVGIMKPISTGPRSENDAFLLKKRLKLKDPIDLINPVRFKNPLAPYVAAKIQKTSLKLSRLAGSRFAGQTIFKAFNKLNQKHAFVLVEGIGGVLVPLTENYFVADLIKDFGLPTIIVARAGLGTINHTLLTIEALKTRKIKIEGIVINGYRGKELSEKTNAAVIQAASGVPVIATLPWED